MIIHGVMSVWLLCLIAEARGVDMDLSGIEYSFRERSHGSYVTFRHKVEDYSIKLSITTGTMVYCDEGALVKVNVYLYRGREHVSVPFNVSCNNARNTAYVKDITALVHPHSMRLSWRVSDGSIDKYIIYYMAEGKYHYKVFKTLAAFYLLEDLKKGTKYQICVATIDGRSETGMYKCKSLETDISETGPVEDVTVTASITYVEISWRKPQNDVYGPSSYTVNYMDPHGVSCKSIMITMVKSEENMIISNQESCVLRGLYTWDHLKPLNITDLLPYTLYNITILPVKRDKKYLKVTRSVRTKEGRSGKVANLRTTIIGGRLRIEYDAPAKPNGVITGYNIRVVLSKREICDQGAAQILESSTVTWTHRDVPLTYLTRCGHHNIEVAPINGWSLRAGVGEPASVVFDYAPEGALTISNTTARVVSSNLVQISWEHHDHKDDCLKIGFLVELANEENAADCVTQIIHDGLCPQLTEMVRKASICAHNETRKVTATGPSWVVNIEASLGPSRAYTVRIWKISTAVVIQGAPLSISGPDAGCFTDCYGEMYAGVRSHGGCVAWRHSRYNSTHPSRADSICTMKDDKRPWCGTNTAPDGYSYCDVPRCSLPSPATGCVRDVRQVTESSRTTLTWTPPPQGAAIIGVIALLHRDDGTCERSNLHLCEKCADEGTLGAALRAFYVRCGTSTSSKGSINTTTFRSLHHNRNYAVYIIPVLNTADAGEVRNISIKTLLAKPDTPKNLRVVVTSATSILFGWDKMVEDFNYGSPDHYEVILTKSTDVIKTATVTMENAEFLSLKMCTEYCVTVHGVNKAGRSNASRKICQYTLVPGVDNVEIDDIESGPPNHRVVSWTSSGGKECRKSYQVRYRNKYTKTEMYKETNDTRITLDNLGKNMVYTVSVSVAVGGARFIMFSLEKQFYTGIVTPRINWFKRDISFERQRLRVTWGMESLYNGSVFEFIMRIMNESNRCLLSAHFVCRSCPHPYLAGNLDEWNKAQREELLTCAGTKRMEFSKEMNTFHYLLTANTQLTNFTVEIFAINIVGVHRVYSRETLYKGKGDHPPLSSERSVIKKIAFFAGSRRNLVSKAETFGAVVFDRPITNVGGAYNSITGEFKAPTPGVYVFALTISAPNGTKASVRLFKNMEHVLDFQTIGRLSEKSSTQAILELKINERVWLQYENYVQLLLGHMNSSFSGYLLFDSP